MQVFKHFPGRAWPDHGFGKEMQERALPELASRPLLRRAVSTDTSQPGHAGSQPDHVRFPSIFICFILIK